MNRLSRRSFLGHTGIALAASSQLGLLARSAHADVTEGYRAMVCILLAGGADSFNMLVPRDSGRYNTYASVRADLALPDSDLLPLDYTGASGEQFGVHPGLAEVQQLFNAGQGAFVANIGPLAEPTSRAALDAGAVQLPLGLFSHSDQIAVWQSSAAGTRINTGFAGRLGDVVQPQLPAGPVSMNISLSGTNLFQSGDTLTGYAMDPTDGVRGVAGYDDAANQVFIDALDRLLALDYADPFRRSYAQKLRGAIDSGAQLNAALALAPEFTTSFSDTELSAAMAQIARVISVRDQLGAGRQTFFVTMGGWDHHDEVLDNQARMLPVLSRALGEFHSALTELGVLPSVTTYTISDFGRTLTSNGRGSDHGWGGHNFVMGGSVNGGQVYGEYPDLTPGLPLDLGRGRYIPTTSTDEFYAELALWFGLSGAQLPAVLPNIGRFYDTAGSSRPLGFLA